VLDFRRLQEDGIYPTSEIDDHSFNQYIHDASSIRNGSSKYDKFLFLCCKYAAVCGVEMLLSFMPFTTFLIAGHQRGAEMRQHRQVRPPEGAERRQIQR
jgi:hypothetical protein